jgi:hypothetical protein
MTRRSADSSATNDDADVIVENHATHTGANMMTFDPHAYEVTAVSVVETSGKVRIDYDESNTTRRTIG